jgi:tRNA G18 (ribose-2'-O)-methylase SpoU
MRGYFAIGVEDISKPHNAGNLMRSAHAFGASFFFAVKPDIDFTGLRQSDTSEAAFHMPFYEYASVEALILPRGCRLVGVEFLPEAEDLPSFKHPIQAAYAFGPEKGNLSPALLARCDEVVKIPTKFCVNVGVAGALVMYDRMIALGNFAERRVGTRAAMTRKPPPRDR